MATTTTRRPRISAQRTGAGSYDAFVSYSHAADGRLAPALQAGLQSLAKRWYRRRALRVFRDETSLSASPELWGSIEAALSQARYFVLLASPTAEDSHWVDQEVRWWRANRGHDTVLIALTDGELDWDDERGDFGAAAPIPPGLRDWFPGEPLWVDLRWARDDTDVSMRNPRFRDCVGELAAPMHGLPKDELIGEDISQHRRTLRLARGAVALLAVLLALAVVGGIVALIQRNQAKEQAQIAHSQALAASAGQVLSDDPALSTRLAAEAVQTVDTLEAERMLRRAEAGLGNGTLLAGHRNGVRTAAFSPEGERIVTTSEDGTARTWDAESGAILATMRPGGRYSNAAFSPDGELVMTAVGGRTARVWDAGSGAELETMRGQEGVVSRAALESVWMVTGSGNQTPIWDKEARANLRALPGRANTISISADRERIVSTLGRTARVWDAEARTELAVLRGHTKTVSTAAISADGRRVVTTSYDGTARIWDAATGTELEILRGHRHPVYGAAFSPDGKLVATAGGDGTTRFWDAATGTQLETLPGHRGIVWSVAFSPDGESIVTASDDGTARIWDAPREALQVLRLGGSGSSAAFSPDGEQVLTTAGVGAAATIWDAASGNKLKTVAGTQGVVGAGFSPDGERIVTVRPLDPTAAIWDAASGADPTILRGHGQWVETASFSPDGQRVVTAAYDRTARIWDAETGAELETLRDQERHTVASAAFSPDGERVVTAGVDGTAIWDAASGVELHTLRAGDQGVVWSASFSPDGKWVVSTGVGGPIIWDVASGVQLQTLAGRAASVKSAAFSPDGEWVVTAGVDRTVRIWDAASGAQLEVLRGHRNVVTNAVFSPDGERIVTASNDGTARIWDCGLACQPLPALLERAPRIAGTLSRAERTRYLTE